MSKHTPGPWMVELKDDEHVIYMGSALVDRAGFEVHHRITYDHGLWDAPDATDVERAQYEEACANADLIGAAPDLLACCRAMLDLHKTGSWGAPPGEYLPSLRAAIAKATGEAQP